MAPTLTDRCTEQLRNEILSGVLETEKGLITEKALCKRFGVSRVTVRRALSRLREENLLRSIPYKGYVLGPAAIAERGAGASGGRVAADHILFVCAPHPDNRFTHRDAVFEAAVKEGAKKGRSVEIRRSPLALLLEEIESRKEHILGVAAEWYEREVVETLLAAGIPTVMAEYAVEGMPLDAVYQDNRGGTEQAVERLCARGHKNIGMVVWNAPAFQPLERRAAFAVSLMRREGGVSGRVGTSERFDAAGGREATRMLLEASEPPSALIVCHPEMLAGVLDEIASRGKRPGEDVALITWGTVRSVGSHLAGSRWSGMETELDRIEWSREEMGRMIVRAIEARAEDPMIPPMRVDIKTRLVLNGSS